MSLYRVTGPFEYQGYKPGQTFEANLDPDIERRGVRRGNIIILDRTRISLKPGSYTLPRKRG